MSKAKKRGHEKGQVCEEFHGAAAKRSRCGSRGRRPTCYVKKIGDGWVFPAPRNAEQAVTRHLARDWWQQLEAKAGLASSPGRGGHALRRKFATELKQAPLRDLAALGGWRGPQTIVKCYQHEDPATLRQALATRQVLRWFGTAANRHRIDTTAGAGLKWESRQVDIHLAAQQLRGWAWVELNYRPHAYQACALTT